MTLVDTNVLIDLMQNNAEWAGWSDAKLFEAQQAGTLTINLVGDAELMPAFDSMADLDGLLKSARIAVKGISRPAVTGALVFAVIDRGLMTAWNASIQDLTQRWTHH